MPLKILQLKFKILFRNLGEYVFFGKVLLLALVAAGLYAVYVLTGLAPHRFVVAGVVAVVLLGLHLRRRDHAFCRRLLPHPFRLFVLEYFLGVAPILIIALLRGQLLLALLYAALPPLVAAVPRSTVFARQRALRLPACFPDLDTVSFFRRSGLIVCGVLALAAGLCFAPAISVVLVYLLVLFSSVGIFTQCESLTLLCLEGLPARQFLRRKIWRQVRFWAVPVLPVLALYAVFNWDTAWYALIPLALCPFQIVAAVCAKYRAYAPNRYYAGTMSQALCLGGFIIPVFLPVSIILSVVFYHGAVQHLKTFLYAYDR
jgi:hypothetical protein